MFRFGRVSSLFALGAILASSAYAQNAFVNPHVLTDSSGIVQGIAWDPIAGQAQVVDKGATTGTFDALFSLYGNDSIFKWLTANVNGTPTLATFDFYSAGKDEPLVWTGADMSPQEIVLPGCDGDSKDAAGMRLSGRITFKAKEGSSFPRAREEAKKQKLWSPANFRLRLGDLPCSRTLQVDSIDLHRTTGDLDGDGFDDIYFKADAFSFQVPIADSPLFQKAFQATTSGTPLSYPFQLDYLDTDGNVLVTVTMTCTVVGAGTANMWLPVTDANAAYRVVVRPVLDSPKSLLNVIR